MIKICVVLCFSLIASLIHAAVMPIDWTKHNSQHPVTESSVHHCDEGISNSQDTNTNQPCHGDSYQCCLGLVVIPILNIELSDIPSQAPPSTGSSFVLQPIINFIYKPPKA
jgi:hypothetical protein